MKHKYGNWIDDIPVLTQPGQYTLFPLNSSSNKNVCYRINSPDANQFYVLEYRKRGGLHENIPGSGIIIYRIDTRFDGNANYNGTTVLNEVYAFRREGSMISTGILDRAYFSKEARRTEFHTASDPYPFLADGTIDDSFRIDGVSSSSEDSITFWFNMPEGVDINNYDINHAIQISPSLVSDHVNIMSFENSIIIKYVDIYDMYGKLIKTEMVNDHQGRINCSNLSPGMYIMQLKDDRTILKTSKIIKQ